MTKLIFSQNLGTATENSSSKSESSTLGRTSRTDFSTLGRTSRCDSGRSKVSSQEEEEVKEMSPLIEEDQERSNRTTSAQTKTEVGCQFQFFFKLNLSHIFSLCHVAFLGCL